MDDLQFGTRNKRGDWAPSAHLELPPIWRRPFNLPRVLAWIPEYLFPWNAFHMATALLWWFFVVPDVATMQTLSWSWGLWLTPSPWPACWPDHKTRPGSDRGGSFSEGPVSGKREFVGQGPLSALHVGLAARARTG